MIDNTFSQVDNYEEKLNKIWSDLNVNKNTYNYRVYTGLVKLLDPITQAMIYYKQGDMKSFENLTQIQKFLAMFLLGNKDQMEKYLPLYSGQGLPYNTFIKLSEGKKIYQNILDDMLIEIAAKGSIQGVKRMEKEGANIHAYHDWALTTASGNGHLEVVKYLVEHDANMHANNHASLILAISNGQLEVVKYLVDHGANIHAQHDMVLIVPSEKGYLEIVKYLVEHGANIHANYDEPVKLASQNGHLEVVKYLVEHGADIHAKDPDDMTGYIF